MTLGVNPEWTNLEYFFAASGYVAAAAINNLTDPPFVFAGSWAIAPFQIPPNQGAGTNESVVVPTVGIESDGGCELADTIAIDSDDAILRITGTWDGCTVTANATDTNSDQYGVLPVANCATHPEDDAYKPVLFWFYSFQLNNASLVFCKPKIQLWRGKSHVLHPLKC